MEFIIVVQHDIESRSSDEVSLENYVFVILRKWWIIVAVLTVSIAFTVFTAPSEPADLYEARIKILLIDPVSERIASPETNNILSVFRSSISPSILASLGTAGDLLEQIITKLNLRDSNTGLPWSVETLSSLMSVDIQKSGTLPLITMTVNASDASTATEIADAWAGLFVEQNNAMFAAELSRSHQFILRQYETIGQDLKRKEEEKLRQLGESPVDLLWNKSEAITLQYQEFIAERHVMRSKLVDTEARLESITAALAREPELIHVERPVSNAALIDLILELSDGLDLGNISDLTVVVDEQNDLHLFLKHFVVLLDAEIASLSANIAYLGSEIATLENEIKDLSVELETRRSEASRLDRDIQILTDKFDQLGLSLGESKNANAEGAGSFLVVESPEEPSSPVPVADPQPRRIVIAAAVGLVLGLVGAFGVDRAQKFRETTSGRTR